MGKYLKMLGYLILLFLVISKYININLPDVAIVSLGVLSAIFMCAGIYMSDTEKAKKSLWLTIYHKKHPHEMDAKIFTSISGRLYKAGVNKISRGMVEFVEFLTSKVWVSTL